MSSEIQKEVEWVKIMPYPCMNVYPEISYASAVFSQMKCLCTQPVPFVEFLKIVYFLSPDVITRLIEPPVANVYSLWLFKSETANFAPVILDPYFPIHEGKRNDYSRVQQSSAHCCTMGYPYIWLPLFIKAIIKKHQNRRLLAYGSDSLKQVSIGSVYHMLTGLAIEEIKPENIAKINIKKDKY